MGNVMLVKPYSGDINLPVAGMKGDSSCFRNKQSNRANEQTPRGDQNEACLLKLYWVSVALMLTMHPDF